MLLQGFLYLFFHHAFAEEAILQGQFSDSECIICHTQRDPNLIRQLSESSHNTASGVSCSSCHGSHHEGANEKARKEQNCIRCHKGSVSHTYALSKHGVINQLNQDRQDWSQPLQRGNYRSPTCSYCHLHNADHNDTMAAHREPGVRQWICSGCHSPRYVRKLFANSMRQLKIADLKLTEGQELIDSTADDQAEALLSLQQQLVRHRGNVLYGVGHQSPDYQWWHGQAALDGDLIRIRDIINPSNHH